MRSTNEPAQRTANTVNALRRLRGYSDAKLGERAGMSRSQVEARRAGRATIDVNDLEALAAGLDVPTPVLLMDAPDAIRWILDNETGDDLRFLASGCLDGTALATAS